MDELKNKLSNLESAMGGNLSQVIGFDRLSIVQGIQQIVGELDPSTSWIHGCGSLLFGTTENAYNLFSFIRDALPSTDTEMQKARGVCFDVVTKWIRSTKKRGVIDHYETILRECFNGFLGDSFASNKVKALQPLIEIYRLEGLTIDPESLPKEVQVNLMGVHLFDVISLVKTRATVRCAAMELVGILIDMFPNEFASAVAGNRRYEKDLGFKIYDRCMILLKKHVEGGGEEMKNVEGAMKCLTGILNNNVYGPTDDDELFQVFTLIDKALRPGVELNRFGSLVATLELLKEHAELFVPLVIKRIGKEAQRQYFENFFDVVHEFTKHRNKDVRYVAIDATLDILDATGKALVIDSEKDDENTKNGKTNLLDRFMTWFNLKLEEIRKATAGNASAVNVVDVEIAVKGYGSFANAVKVIRGEHRVAQVLDHLRETNQMIDRQSSQNASLSAYSRNLKWLSFGGNAGLLSFGGERQSDPQENSGGADGVDPSQLAYSMAMGNKEQLVRRTRFLEAYSKIIMELSTTYISENNTNILDYLGMEIDQLFDNYPMLYLRDKITVQSTLKSIFAALVDKGFALSYILTKRMPRMMEISCSLAPPGLEETVAMYHPDTGLPDKRLLFQYESLWQRLLPSTYKSRKGDLYHRIHRHDTPEIDQKKHNATVAILDFFVQRMVRMVQYANLEVESNSMDDGEDDEEEEGEGGSEWAAKEGYDGAMQATPKNIHDYVMFSNLVALCERIFPPKSRYFIAKYLDRWTNILCQVICEGSIRFAHISGFYTLMEIVFRVFASNNGQASVRVLAKDDEDVKSSFLSNANRFLDSCFIRSKQYKGTILIACLKCVLKAPLMLVKSRMSQFQQVIIRSLKLGLTDLSLGNEALQTLDDWQRHGLLGVENYIEILPSVGNYLSSSKRAKNEIRTSQMATGSDKRIEYVRQQLSRSRDVSMLSLERIAIEFLGQIGGNSRYVLPPLEQSLQGCFTWDTGAPRAVAALPLGYNLMVEVVLDSALPRIVDLALNCSERAVKVVACELLHSLVLSFLGWHRMNTYMSPTYKKLLPEILRLAVEQEPVARKLFRTLSLQLAAYFASNLRSEEESITGSLLDAAVDNVCDKTDAELRDLCANIMGIYFRYSLKSRAHGSSSANPNVSSLLRRMFFLMLHPDPYHRLGGCLVFSNIFRDLRNEESVVVRYILEIYHVISKCLALSYEDDPAVGTREAAEVALGRLCRILTKDVYVAQLSDPNNKLQHGEIRDYDELIRWAFQQCWKPQSALRKLSRFLFRQFVFSKVQLKDHFAKKRDSARFVKEWILANNEITLPFQLAKVTPSTGKDTNLVLGEVTGVIDATFWLLKNQYVANDKDRTFDNVLSSIESTCETLLDSSIVVAKDRMFSFLITSMLLMELLLELKVPIEITDVRSFFVLQMRYLLYPHVTGFNRQGVNEERVFFPAAKRLLKLAVKIDPLKRALIEIGSEMIADDPHLSLQEVNFHAKGFGFILRGHRILQEVGIPILPDPSNSRRKIAQALLDLKVGTSPTTLQVAVRGLDLCFDLKWDLESVAQETLRNDHFLMNFKEPLLGYFLHQSRWRDVMLILIGKLSDSEKPLDFIIAASEEMFVNISMINSTRQTMEPSVFVESIVTAFQHNLDFLDAQTKGFMESLPSALHHKLCLFLRLIVKLQPEPFHDKSQPHFRVATKILDALFLLHPTDPVMSMMIDVSLVIPHLYRGTSRLCTLQLKYEDNPEKNTDLEEKITKLIQSKMITAYFPLIVNDPALMQQGERDRFTSLLDALFTALEQSGAIPLLKLLWGQLSDGPHHVYAEGMAGHLTNLANNVNVQTGTDGRVPGIHMIRACFGVIVEDQMTIGVQVRSSLLSLVMSPLLQRLSYDSWKAFLQEEDYRCLRIMVGSINQYNTLWDNANAIERLASCFDILKILYTSLSKAQIDQLFAGRYQDKNLTKTLCMLANKIMTKLTEKEERGNGQEREGGKEKEEEGGADMKATAENDDGILLNGIRVQKKRYGNATFQFLCVAISRTQKAIGPYEKFIFMKSLQSSTRSFFWDVLVPKREGPETEPYFAVETNFQSSKLNVRDLVKDLELKGLPVQAYRETQFASSNISQLAFSQSQVFGAQASSMIFDDQYDGDDANDKSSSNAGFDPDLEEDIFSLMKQGGEKKQKNKENNNSNKRKADEDDVVDIDDDDNDGPKKLAKECALDETDSLEMDALNRLPCMVSTLVVLDVLRQKQIAENATGDQVQLIDHVAVAPIYLRAFFDALKERSGRSSINVRLFALKVIMNRPTFFAAAAPIICVPCIKVLLDLEEPYREERGFHYMLRDMCILVGRWERASPGSTRPGPNDHEKWKVLSSFVNHLISVSSYEKASIQRTNLEMVGMLISYWKKKSPEVEEDPGQCDGLVLDRLAICTKFLIPGYADLHKLNKVTKEFKRIAFKRQAGLALVAIFANSGYDPTYKLKGGEIEGFARSLPSNIPIASKSLSPMAAEICATILPKLTTNTANMLKDALVKALERLEQDRKDEIWILCVHSFLMATDKETKNVEPIYSRHYVNAVQSYFQKAVIEGTMLRQLLDIYEKLIQREYPHLTMDEFLIGYLGGLKHAFSLKAHSTGIVKKAVQITYFFLDSLGQSNKTLRANVGNLISIVSHCALNHPKPSCRVECFKLLMRIRSLIPKVSLEGDKGVILTLNRTMAQGLGDSSKYVQEVVFNFWDSDDENNLLPSTSPYTRLCSCLSVLSTVGSNDNNSIDADRKNVSIGGGSWVAHTTTLLLALVRKSQNYDDPNVKMFQNSLDEGGDRFSDMTIDGSWKSMITNPLDNLSQGIGDGNAGLYAQFGFSQMTQGVSDGAPRGMLRATQAGNLFLPTQQMGGGVNFGTQAVDDMGDGPGQLESFSQMVQPQQTKRRKFVQVASASKPVYSQDFLGIFGAGAGAGSKGENGARGTTTSSSMPPPTKKGKFKEEFGGNALPDFLGRKRFVGRSMEEKMAETYFESKAHSQRTQLVAKLQESKKRKERDVTLYRRYRVGEVPDIQITLKELVEPLIAVCSRDGLVAKEVLQGLMRGMASLLITGDKVQFQKLVGEDVPDRIEGIKTLYNLIGSMLSKNAFDDPDVVSTLHALIVVLNESISETGGFPSLEDLPDLDPKTITTSAIRGSCLTSGIVTLESTLLLRLEIMERLNPTKGKKRKSATTIHQEGTAERTKSQLKWMQLLQLYESLGQEDVIGGVLSIALDSTLADEAFRLKEDGALVDAAEKFKELIERLRRLKVENSGSVEDELFDQQSQFWWKNRVDCYRQMTKWSSITKDMEAEADVVLQNYPFTFRNELEGIETTALWHRKKFSTHVIPYCQAALRHEREESRCLAMMEKVLSDPLCHPDFLEPSEQQYWLNRWGAVELTLFDLKRSQLASARARMETYFDSFARIWSSVSDLGGFSRISLLRPLMSFVDLSHFFKMRDSIIASGWDREVVMYQVKVLTDRWLTSMPSTTLDSLFVWDDVTYLRICALQSLVRTLPDYKRDVLDGEVRSISRELTIRSRILFSFAALEQSQLSMAKSSIKRARSLIVSSYNSEVYGIPPPRDVLLSHWKSQMMYREKEAEMSVLSGQRAKAISSLGNALGTDFAFNDDDGLDMKVEVWQTQAMLQAKLASIDVDNRAENEQKAWDIFRKCVDAGESAHMDTTYGEFARFLDETLEAHVKSGKPISFFESREDDLEAVACALIDTVLKGTRLGSKAALDRLPRIMSTLASQGSKRAVRKQFEASVQETPSWVFLPWISQLFALLDKSELGEPVTVLVRKLAKEYPDALQTSFNVTTEVLMDRDSLDDQTKIYLEEIKLGLKNDLFDTFLEACKGLYHPQKKFLAAIDEIKALGKRSSKGPYDFGDNLAKAESIWKRKVIDDVLALEKPKVGAKIGRYNAQFIQQFGTTPKRQIGETEFNVAGFTKYCHDAKIMEKIKQSMAKDKKKQLKDFSEWMQEFQHSDFTESLDIPGQYEMIDAYSPPRTSECAKIASFSPDITVMSSKEKPKVVTMRGTDEKDYKFLVKGGDDLRLDQRIEQIFHAMNRMFQADGECSVRNLAIKTYKVIPLTQDLGLLEWVDGTKTISSILTQQYVNHPQFPIIEGGAKLPTDAWSISGSSMSSSSSSYRSSSSRSTAAKSHGEKERKKKFENLSSWKCFKKYYAWLIKMGGNESNHRKLYANLYQITKSTADHVREAMEQIYGFIPGDLLRRHLLQLAIGPESFVMIRENFARSLGVSCIATYVCGIGDRHLENILFHETSGALVHIDFGYSFGFGVTDLPVPELMPCRLTRQFQQVLQPLDKKSILHQSMIHSMRVCRENYMKLESVMEVFVHEPTIRWSRNAEKKTRDRSDFDQDDDKSGHDTPKDFRVEIFKRKVRGCHPLTVMSCEINSRTSAHIKPSDPIHTLKMAFTDTDLADLPRTDLKISDDLDKWSKTHTTVQEQVDALISIATDSNLLAKQWMGAMPMI